MPRGLAEHLAAYLAVAAAVLLGASVMPALAAAPDQGAAPARIRSAQASSKPTCTDGPAPGARGSEPCDPDAHDRADTTDEESTPSGPAEAPVDRNPVGPPKQKRSARLAQGVVGAAAVDNQFQPMQLTVTVGSRVVWTNEGQNPHTVTADDRAFDSGTIESGQTFAVTFDEIGRVPYYCQIHGGPGSGMFGVVIVRAASGGEADQEGSPVIESGGLAQTGLNPVPIGVAALGLAITGLLALRLGRRAEQREEVTGRER